MEAAGHEGRHTPRWIHGEEGRRGGYDTVEGTMALAAAIFFCEEWRQQGPL